MDLQKVKAPNKLRRKEGPSDPDFSLGQFNSKKEGNPWFGFKLNHTTNKELIELHLFFFLLIFVNFDYLFFF